MDVNRLQVLSKQHKLLTDFHGACKEGNDLWLIAQTSPYGNSNIELDCATTKLIASDVRVSLLKEISAVEKAIKKEATRG